MRKPNMPVTLRDFHASTNADNRQVLREFVDRNMVVELNNGKAYRAVRRVNGDRLEAGMTVLAAYAECNTGADVFEVLGFTDASEKYGGRDVPYNAEKHIAYHSVAELKEARGVTTMKELNALQDEPEYGYGNYLVARDLDYDPDGLYPECGPWYCLFEGHWSRGSGAEALSFVVIEEVEDYEPPAPDASYRYQQVFNSRLGHIGEGGAFVALHEFDGYVPRDGVLERLAQDVDVLSASWRHVAERFSADARDLMRKVDARLDELKAQQEDADA